MRARAARLHDSSLTLRQEAEDLFAGSTEELEAVAAKNGTEPPATTEPTPPATTEPTPPATPTEPAPAEPAVDPCADGSDGDDTDKRGRHDDDEDYWNDVAEACQLIATADRLDRRAAALTVAADRMTAHANNLRERAAKLLACAGETDAQRWLKKAAKMRAAAAKMRTKADGMRDSSFTGTEVVKEVVTKIEKLETRAAQLDAAADRFEKKAAAAAAPAPATT